MNTLEFNLNAMGEKYPELVNTLKEMRDDGTTRLVPTKVPGCDTLEVRGDSDSKWFIHSKENPREEAAIFIDNIVSRTLKFSNVVVVLGVGLGYYLEQMFRHYAASDTVFILVEQNLQIFKQFITVQRPCVVEGGQTMSMFNSPKVHLMIGVHPEQSYNYLFDYMQSTGRNSHSTFAFIEHPVLIRFNKGYYKPITNIFERVCYDIRSSYGNDPEDSWIGIDHMLQNLDVIANNPGIIQVKDKFKDVPAVIVATGPSLNKNINLLPKVINKAVFFAADASLNTFLKRDLPILPDIVCSLERNLSTANHFKQIPEEKKKLMDDIWLCACPVIMPPVYEAWEGKIFSLYRDFAHFKWINCDKGLVNTGKSVTNMAWKAAEYMGCNPIILVGQDLAFAPDGNSHVKGADHARDGLKKSQLIKQRVKVMGNDGKPIESLDTWVGMLKRFEFDIAKNGGKTKTINATEGGARILGTECMTLQDAIDKYCIEDVGVYDRLNADLEYPDAGKVNDDNTNINEAVLKGIEFLSDCYKMIDDCLDTMEDASPLFFEKDPDIEELKLIFNYCEKVKSDVLNHPLCYPVAMHVLQSWCMGRENIFRSIDNMYKDHSEIRTAKYIRIFEFFYGLRKLFKMLLDGVKNDYGNWKGRVCTDEAVSGVPMRIESGNDIKEESSKV